MEGSAERPSLFQYWHSEEIPDEVAVLLETFKTHNPDFHHQTFDEPAALDLIATHFGGREADCFRLLDVPAMQADYFRCCALLALGGIYVDADSRCRRSLSGLITDGVGAALRERQQGPPLPDGGSAVFVGNDLLVFREPGHPLLELVLEMATAAIERNRHRTDRGRFAIVLLTGPAIFSGLLLAHELGSFAELSRFLTDTGFAQFGHRLRNVVGEYGRLADAFREVRVLSVEEAESFIELEIALPYKNTSRYWARHGPEIFRPTAAGGRRA